MTLIDILPPYQQGNKLRDFSKRNLGKIVFTFFGLYDERHYLEVFKQWNKILRGV